MIKAYRYTFLWAIFILFVCGVNGSSLPKLRFQFTLGIDKIAHFILFGTQAWLLLLSLLKTKHGSKSKLAFTAALISSVYGVVIEFLQATVFVNRTYDYEDMLANAIGAFLCLPFSLLLRKQA